MSTLKTDNIESLDTGRVIEVDSLSDREDLANDASGYGASLVSMEDGPSVEAAVLDRVIRVTSVASMLAITPAAGFQVSIENYHGDYEGGGGVFYWDSAKDKADHNGGSIIDPDVAFPSDWDNQTQLTAWFTAGTGTGCWVMNDSETLKAVDFGVKGDWDSDTSTGTDDTQAMQSLIAASNLTLKGITAKYLSILVSETLEIMENCDFEGSAVYAPSLTVSPVIKVGTFVSTDQTVIKLYRLPTVYATDKPSDGWNAGTVGIQYGNLYQCVTHTPRVSGFDVGEWYGGTRGHAYNEHHHEMPYGNKVNVLLKPDAAGAWVNENTFYGGRHGAAGSDTTDWTGTVQLKMEVQDQDQSLHGGPNNNLFIRPSLESDNYEYNVMINGGAYNRILQARYEGDTKQIYLGHPSLASGCARNLFDGGYQLSQSVFVYGGNTSYNAMINDSGRSKLNPPGYGTVMAISSGDNSPHYIGFTAAEDVLNKSHLDNDWMYKISANRIELKDSTDAYARVGLDYRGRITFGNGSAEPTDYMRSYGAGNIRVNFDMVDETDNTHNIGSAANRWATIYAGTGTINTSDAREKQQVAALDAKEKLVAVELKGLIRKFKFNDAVLAKGDLARIHVGVIAQEVVAAFANQGLDAHTYGMICYDEWEEDYDKEEDALTEAGNRYGVRYEELLCFIIGCL